MSYINIIKTNTKEKGIALITVMLMMAVMTVLAITMFNTSTVESLISSNYRTSKEAFFDADAGVHYALARIKADLENTGNNIDAPDDINLGGYSASGFNFNFNLEAIGNWVPNNNPYCFTSTGQGSNNASAEIKVCFEHTENFEIDPAFTTGIVSDGNITINGDAFITNGSIHANGKITINESDGTGYVYADPESETKANISAADEVIINSETGGTSISDNANIFAGEDHYIEVPEITNVYLDEKRNEVLDIIAEYEEGVKDGIKYIHYDSAIGPNNALSGDLSNTVIFADHNIHIHQDATVENTTIISNGDVTFNGKSEFQKTPGTDPINTAIIANGDIIFNGSGDTYGLFWCNGDFTRRGSNTTYGSIVAATGFENPDITLSGDYYFTGFKDFDNDFIPKKLVHNIFLKSWKDQSLE